eukprot:gene13685-13807_t
MDEEVTVLEMVLDSRRVAAVALRDNKQPARPIKVYVGGVFAAAILDDVVMEPLTGQLLAVLYRYSTPGVHHLYFYQPFLPQADSSKTGSSRVLASRLLFPGHGAEADGQGNTAPAGLAQAAGNAGATAAAAALVKREADKRAAVLNIRAMQWHA